MLKTLDMDRRRRLGTWAASLVVICAAGSACSALAADSAAIPNFAPDSLTGWLKPLGDEFIQPETGPGPVRADPAHPYAPNFAPFVSRGAAPQQTVMIADLTAAKLADGLVDAFQDILQLIQKEVKPNKCH